MPTRAQICTWRRMANRALMAVHPTTIRERDRNYESTDIGSGTARVWPLRLGSGGTGCRFSVAATGARARRVGELAMGEHRPEPLHLRQRTGNGLRMTSAGNRRNYTKKLALRPSPRLHSMGYAEWKSSWRRLNTLDTRPTIELKLFAQAESDTKKKPDRPQYFQPRRCYRRIGEPRRPPPSGAGGSVSMFPAVSRNRRRP